MKPSGQIDRDQKNLASAELAELEVQLGLFVQVDRQRWLLVGFAVVALVLKGERMGGRELVHHQIFLDEAYWLVAWGVWSYCRYQASLERELYWDLENVKMDQHRKSSAFSFNF